MADLTTVFTAFLHDHPEMLTHVRYRSIAGSDEPEMFFNATATRAFLAWGMARGYVGTPELVPPFLEAITQAERGEPHPLFRRMDRAAD